MERERERKRINLNLKSTAQDAILFRAPLARDKKRQVHRSKTENFKTATATFREFSTVIGGLHLLPRFSDDRGLRRGFFLSHNNEGSRFEFTRTCSLAVYRVRQVKFGTSISLFLLFLFSCWISLPSRRSPANDVRR